MNVSLPIELVEKILSLAARSNLEICKNLCFISSWTRKIALIHLLYFIDLSEMSMTTRKTNALLLNQFNRIYSIDISRMPISSRHPLTRMLSPPLKPFSEKVHHVSLVKRIWMSDTYPIIWNIIMACTGLTHLSISTSPAMRPPWSEAKNRLGVERLMVVANSQLDTWPVLFERIKIYSSIVDLERITHLHLTGSYSIDGINLGDLRILPRITHLALSLSISYGRLEDHTSLAILLENLPKRLELVVFVFPYSEHSPQNRLTLSWLRNKREADQRLYVFCADWRIMKWYWLEENAWGPSFWERAIQWTEKKLNEVK